MNARELYVLNDDGTYSPAGVYYCGECHLTATSESWAEQCCKPGKCEGCGDPTPRGWTLCSPCRFVVNRAKLVAKHDAAEKVKLADYEGRMVYVEPYEEYVMTSELDEWVKEKREDYKANNLELLAAWEPPMVFATYEEHYLVNADYALEQALCDAFEDAHEHVDGEAKKKLAEYLTSWSNENLPTGYMVDYKIAVEVE